VKIYIYFSGKPKDAHANALSAEYVKRAGFFAPTAMHEVRSSKIAPATEVRTRHPQAKLILLDPAGRRFDSEKFAKMLADAEMRGQDLVFLVGGHDGHSPSERAAADLQLSLSDLTLPHELARAVLAEQIYRGFTILRGHPYSR